MKKVVKWALATVAFLAIAGMFIDEPVAAGVNKDGIIDKQEYLYFVNRLVELKFFQPINQKIYTDLCITGEKADGSYLTNLEISQYSQHYEGLKTTVNPKPEEGMDGFIDRKLSSENEKERKEGAWMVTQSFAVCHQ
jgi:hypothetical protein